MSAPLRSFARSCVCHCALAFAFVLAGAVSLGCSSAPAASTGPAAGQCPDIPASCPTPMPAYQDVSPIVQRDCVPCHAAATGGKDETSYDLVYAQRNAVLVQVGNCLMPPGGSPQLQASERDLLLTWLVCGAPN
jgi:hypothetical protein